MTTARKVTRKKKEDAGVVPVINRKAANWAGSNGIGDFKLTPHMLLLLGIM